MSIFSIFNSFSYPWTIQSSFCSNSNPPRRVFKVTGDLLPYWSIQPSVLGPHLTLWAAAATVGDSFLVWNISYTYRTKFPPGPYPNPLHQPHFLILLGFCFVLFPSFQTSSYWETLLTLPNDCKYHICNCNLHHTSSLNLRLTYKSPTELRELMIFLNILYLQSFHLRRMTSLFFSFFYNKHIEITFNTFALIFHMNSLSFVSLSFKIQKPHHLLADTRSKAS